MTRFSARIMLFAGFANRTAQEPQATGYQRFHHRAMSQLPRVIHVFECAHYGGRWFLFVDGIVKTRVLSFSLSGV